MLQKPGVLLSEVQNELTSVLAVDVDVSTICRFLQASGFTRQKLQYVALQRDEFLRQLDMSIHTPDMLVFLDESGADKYGCSMRGKPAQKHALLVRGEHVSAIANISVSGLLDVDVVKGPVDGDRFYEHIY